MLRTPLLAEQRVLGIQTKLHSRAKADPGRRVDDLFNRVFEVNRAWLVASALERSRSVTVAAG
jgi:hypothetical protein